MYLTPLRPIPCVPPVVEDTPLVAPQHDLLALLGQKALGLCHLLSAGVPVPSGFVLTTDFCRAALAPADGPLDLRAAAAGSARIPDDLWEKVRPAMQASLADLARAPVPPAQTPNTPSRPLVLAVRGGATHSMPGMLVSLLNVGLCPATLPALAAFARSRPFALDCYARFLRQLAAAYLPGPASSFLRTPHPALVSDEALVFAAEQQRQDLHQHHGIWVPDDLLEQLRLAISAVLASLSSPRTQEYRRLFQLPDDLATAVTVQQMVFGDLGPASATGVLFTRDPSTGQPTSPQRPFGEFLPCAQGEEVVGGTGMPRPLAQLQSLQPTVYAQLLQAAASLERTLYDMQDIEFTIEEGQLYFLQTRPGKRSSRAMLRIAMDLHREGILSAPQALLRLEPARLAEALQPTLSVSAQRTLFARGLPASPGIATGRIVLTTAQVLAAAATAEPVLLVRTDTSSDDVAGIRYAAGLLTARGGLTSHAAVVARGLGRAAVVGAQALSIDLRQKTVSTREHVVSQGDLLTLDGTTGHVYLGRVPLSVSPLLDSPDYQWLRALTGPPHRRLRLFADLSDAETPPLAQALGADGLASMDLATFTAAAQALSDAALPWLIHLTQPTDLSALLAHIPPSLTSLSVILPLPAHCPDPRAWLQDLRGQLSPHRTRLRGELPLVFLPCLVDEAAQLAPLLDPQWEGLALHLPDAQPLPETTLSPACQAALSQVLPALRAAHPALSLGLFARGVHAPFANPPAVALVERLGLDWLVCRPLKLAQCALAATQAHLCTVQPGI